MRRRGFTFYELAIVLFLMATMAGPFLHVAAGTYDHFRSLTVQGDLQNGAAGAAYQIFRRVAATGRGTLDPDNQGLRFGDGSRVRREGTDIVLHEGTRAHVLLSHVDEFAAIRRDGMLTVYLALTVPLRTRGQPVTWRTAYDYAPGGRP